MKSRRNFFKTASLTLGASGLLPLVNHASTLSFSDRKELGKMLNMGMAGFTFTNYSIDQTISMMNRVAVVNLSLKEAHLPITATQEQANEVVGKYKAGGINIYAVGVIYMKDKSEVDRAFEYAKKVGVTLIIGVPEYDLLPYTEEKVKSTGMRIAIHNHGPSDKRYPGPKDVYDRIKNMDPKMGLCMDIGHATRAGVNIAQAVLDYKSRLFDLHIKDVTKAVEEGKAIEIGRGIIDFPSVVKALRKINYQGQCSIEFEKDMRDALPGIAESVGFFRGVMKST
jgi:inosose dehydratase